MEIRAERHQKSISVEFSFATVFAFKYHVKTKFHYINFMYAVFFGLFCVTLCHIPSKPCNVHLQCRLPWPLSSDRI
jgi:uncharacterized membrane protein YagU involved in acid resistance